MEVPKLEKIILHSQKALTSKMLEYSYGSCTLHISLM